MLRSFILLSITLLLMVVLAVPEVDADVTRWCPAGDGGVFLGGPAVNRTVDINLDGTVNLIDLAWFAGSYPTVIFRPYDKCADFNNDGLNSLSDFSFYSVHVGHVGAVIGLCD